MKRSACGPLLRSQLNSETLASMTNPYQTPATQSADHAPPPKKFGLAISLLLTAITALVLSFVAPNFRSVFSAFDAELPWWSSMVLNGYLASWLLPVAVVAAWFGWPKPHQQSAIALTIGAVSFLVVLPLCLLALYLPIFNLGAAT